MFKNLNIYRIAPKSTRRNPGEHAHAGECVRSQSFSASSMRVCQPAPVALKAAITSRLSHSVTGARRLIIISRLVSLRTRSHGRTRRLGQKAASGGTVGLCVVVNAAEQQARHGDVDLLSRPQVLLHRHIHHRPHPACVIGVGLVGGNRCSNGNIHPVFNKRLDVQINGFLHAGERIVQIIARRKAAGQIGHTNAVANAIIGVQNNGEFHGAYLQLFAPARLALNAVQRGGGYVPVGVLDSDQTRLGRVLELVVRALCARQIPAIRFELLDHLLAVHGGYCTYHLGTINTISPDAYIATLQGLAEGIRQGEGDKAELMDLADAVTRRLFCEAANNPHQGFGAEVAQKIHAGMNWADLHAISVAANMEAWLRTSQPGRGVAA